jgi:hypothetical protein
MIAIFDPRLNFNSTVSYEMYWLTEATSFARFHEQVIRI